MNDAIGHDCDGNEIYEYMILRAIWSNDIDIEKMGDADPRQYCALVADDGKAYAMSVYDWWYADLIKEREHIDFDDNYNIPVVIKPIEEMVNYEIAICNFKGEPEVFYYEYNRAELKNKLNNLLGLSKTKKYNLNS